MTLEQIEHAYATGSSLDLSRHAIEPAPLTLHHTFFPFGYPVHVRTNSEEVLGNYEQMWGAFQGRRDTPPVVCDVSVLEDDTGICPPEPSYHLLDSQMVFVADQRNYAISNLLRQETRVLLTRGVLRYPLYARYFLLMSPLVHLSTHNATPVHGACVALNGKGVLLCGDSGAGKSTLAYACARAGWTYISDDASYVDNSATDRTVLGDCYKLRFRPETSALFPEFSGLPATPRAAGKPSVEVETRQLGVRCQESVQIDAVVFLKRHRSECPGHETCHEHAYVEPYPSELARLFVENCCFGPPSLRAMQNHTIDRLLTAGVYQMRYRTLDEAIAQLQALVQAKR